MGKKLKIVFVSHDSSYTGAPLLLLQLIEWMKLSKDCSVKIIVLNDGLLRNDFRKQGKVLVINSYRKRLINIVIAIFKMQFPRVNKSILNFRMKLFLKSFHPDLIYVNSVMSLELISSIKKNNDSPVICHVHELEYGISRYLGIDKFKLAIPFIDRFIANSKDTRNNLVNKYLVPDAMIDVVCPHIKISSQNNNKQAFLEELSIDADTFIVMGCGINDWLKGTDLFIYTASALAKITDLKFRFIWIGSRDEESNRKLSYEINTLGLQDKVNLIGFRENPSDYFQCADVFFMSSREESYGMVGLESAVKGVPIICFDTSVGMTEFIGNDAGFVIQYPDYKLVADNILKLMNDPKLKNRLGNEGRRKALEEANIETTGPKIWSVIEELK